MTGRQKAMIYPDSQLSVQAFSDKFTSSALVQKVIKNCHDLMGQETLRKPRE